jgi:hypothetical protein
MSGLRSASAVAMGMVGLAAAMVAILSQPVKAACGSVPCNGEVYCVYASGCYGSGAIIYVGSCPTGCGAKLTCYVPGAPNCAYWIDETCGPHGC